MKSSSHQSYIHRDGTNPSSTCNIVLVKRPLRAQRFPHLEAFFLVVAPCCVLSDASRGDARRAAEGRTRQDREIRATNAMVIRV